ncbi:cysteine--tRNA ligase [Candidatus Falkowbacteria bacterium]|nr:cysteine--tRNA ligase [Candidatus Falkowbacteria bacterium]
MSKLYLYNSLSKKKEEFQAISAPKVGLYTCGPTVYNFAHLGNLRTYLFEDFLKRILIYNDYKVFHVENITDVGHLIGDMDMGEDKMEAGVKREGKSAWEIAKKYSDAFKADLEKLNILRPDVWEKVSDNIPEQINLIKTLEEKSFVYQTSDGLYFDTSKFPNYNKLSHLPLEDLKEGARVEKNNEKKNPTDFALWKFSSHDKKRQMEWESPWGLGFPGWHIECSAISLKHLTNNLDIHCGGADHINIHHTNEIAQSEAATGNKFFNYWLHGAFLNIPGGKKMAKSDDNFLTLKKALIDKNLDPLAYRFTALQVHYRKPMEYSEEILKQAQEGLNSLRRQFVKLDKTKGEAKVNEDLKNKFLEALNDDLNMPKALAVVNSVFKAKIIEAEKYETLVDFDKVLGLKLEDIIIDDEAKEVSSFDLTEEIKEKVRLRIIARENKDFAQADALRLEIEAAGFMVKDEKYEFKIYRK